VRRSLPKDADEVLAALAGVIIAKSDHDELKNPAVVKIAELPEALSDGEALVAPCISRRRSWSYHSRGSGGREGQSERNNTETYHQQHSGSTFKQRHQPKHLLI